MITQQGRVGAISPAAKLEIDNSNNAGAVKVVDGMQTENFFGI